VGDEWLEKLAGLSTLKCLYLPVRISNRGLDRLRRLPALEELYLGYSCITDKAIVRIAQSPRLRLLNLAYTRISDKCLMQLTTLRGLEELDVRGTDISDEGLARLRATLSDCIVDPQPKLNKRRLSVGCMDEFSSTEPSVS
jgi:hypothetical protein